jgi:hypothetical protein
LQTLQLPRHVYVCRTADAIVFLDTRKDCYFGLSGKDADVLAAALHDGHEQSALCVNESLTLPAELRQLTRTLIERGLLTQSRPAGVSRIRTSVPPLEMIPPRLTTDTCRPARAADVANFIVACSRAAWALKWRSLEDIEFEIHSVREKMSSRTTPRNPTALELAQVFRRLRRFVFSEKNRCLFNALSLMYFLRRYGHFPYWVIGVKTAPFAAHSWVQQERIALDGDPALICHFVPILAA